MFNFFKKNREKRINKDLVIKILTLLPISYKRYSKQIEEGLIKDVQSISKPFDYIGYIYNVKISNQYFNSSGRAFYISGIKVFDELSSQFIPFNLHFAYGLVSGYSIPNNDIRKVALDTSQIKGEMIKRNYDDEYGVELLKVWLDEEDFLEYVNPTNVYEIEINNTTYLHLKGTEDGDYICMDKTKNVYLIKSFPFSVLSLGNNLREILS